MIALPAVLFTPPSQSAPQQPVKENQGAVMIIDDEQMIADLVQDVYTSEGVTVFSSSGFENAFPLFKKHYKEIRYVILDVNIPGTSLNDLISRFVEIDPLVRIILTSGDHGFESETQIQDHVVKFLQKPFGPQELNDIYKSF